MNSTPPLAMEQCAAIPPGSAALDMSVVRALQPQVPLWEVSGSPAGLTREFRFKDFHATMAFVNAVAWIAHQQDHHPALQVGYNICRVSWSTHTVDGLSRNDFICAARTDLLLAASSTR